MDAARAAALVIALSACGAGGQPGMADAGRSGDPARGMLLVQMNTCNQAGVCHGSDLGGSTMPVATGSHVYPRNLTPDVATGIATWTDAQIETAVRTGVSPTRTLCQDMLRFPTMPAQDMADVIAYLRSVAAVSRAVPASSCP